MESCSQTEPGIVCSRQVAANSLGATRKSGCVCEYQIIILDSLDRTNTLNLNKFDIRAETNEIHVTMEFLSPALMPAQSYEIQASSLSLTRSDQEPNPYTLA